MQRHRSASTLPWTTTLPPADARLDALQARLGHRFADTGLLQRALTHRSFGADHNERLEFLGDAVVSMAVSSFVLAINALKRSSSLVSKSALLYPANRRAHTIVNTSGFNNFPV